MVENRKRSQYPSNIVNHWYYEILFRDSHTRYSLLIKSHLINKPDPLLNAKKNLLSMSVSKNLRRKYQLKYIFIYSSSQSKQIIIQVSKTKIPINLKV